MADYVKDKNDATTPLPPGGELSKGEEAALRTAAQLWVFNDVAEASVASPEEHEHSAPTAVIAEPVSRLVELEPIHRIAARPSAVMALPEPAPRANMFIWLPLSAVASLLLGIFISHRYFPPPASAAPEIASIEHRTSPSPDVEIARDSAPPMVKDAPIAGVGTKPAPAAPAVSVTAPNRVLASVATVPIDNKKSESSSDFKADLAAKTQVSNSAAAIATQELPKLPELPPIPAFKVAATLPPAPRKANAEALGRRLDSPQDWSALGNLPVITLPGRVEIGIRNESALVRAGGLLCQKPWDLTSNTVSLQLTIDNLRLSPQQDFEFFALDELKQSKDARLPVSTASISLRRARARFDSHARTQRLECILSKAGAASIRLDVRLDGRNILTRIDDNPRGVKKIYLGFRVLSHSESSGETLGVENLSVAYRPKTVAWLDTVDEAQKLAQTQREAFGIYFCDAETCRVAGEGAPALAEYRRQNAGSPPPTIFDVPLVLGEFQSAGIQTFVKAAPTAANADLFKRYAAIPGMLVLCAPDGSTLATFSPENCKQTVIVRFLNKHFKEILDSWQPRFETSTKSPEPKSKIPELAARTEPDVAAKKAAPAIAPAHAALRNSFSIAPRIFAGREISSEDDFQALRELGIRTLVRVDGAAPDLERAARQKIRCVHLPLGFRDISTASAQALAKAVRDLPGPIFFSSSEGHRAYAAAVIAEIVLGQIENAEGLAALQSMGTTSTYSGLLASVKAASKAEPAVLDTLKVEFVSQVSVKPLVRAMAEIDAICSRLENARSENWNPNNAERKEGSLARDAGLLLERYLSLGNMDSLAEQPAAFRETLSESIAAAASFTYTFGAWKKDASTENQSALNVSYARVMQSCLNCHQQFRDAPARK